MKRLIAILGVIFLLGCGYSNYLLQEDLDKIHSSVVKIEIKARSVESGETLTRRAIGFRTKEGYIVGLTHAVKAPFQNVVATPFGMMAQHIETTNRRYFVNGDRSELIGSHEDIALLTGKKGPYIPFGDSDELKKGTEICVLGYSYNIAFNLKRGLISFPKITDQYDKMLKPLGVPIPNRFMLIDIAVNGGDSGSPVIAFKSGNPRIVGVVCAKSPSSQGMNFAFTSNHIQNSIKEIL